MEGEKFRLRNLPSRTLSLLSVLLRTRSAQLLSLHHLAAVLTLNIAELVTSVFFCALSAMVLAAVRKHFPRKKNQHVHVDRHLVMGKEISSKLNFFKYCQCAWRSDVRVGLRCRGTGFDSQRGRGFLFLFLFFNSFNDLNESTFTNK